MILGICQWKWDSDGYFATSCGEAFTFTEGGPSQHGFLYCPWCGDSLSEVSPPFDTTTAEEDERG